MKPVKIIFITLIIGVCLFTFSNFAKAEVIAYDAEGQFLGVLLDSTGGSASIYIPSSERIIDIRYDDGDALRGALFFNSLNCSGMPYINVQASYDIKKIGENYYIGEKVAPVKMKMNSMLPHADLTCKSAGYDYVVVPAIEITPEISMPVALPIRFEHEPAHPGKWNK